MTEPWRYRCPRGHVSVVVRHGESTRGGVAPKARYYCKTCKDNPAYDPHYRYLIDAKTDQVVVD